MTENRENADDETLNNCLTRREQEKGGRRSSKINVVVSVMSVLNVLGVFGSYQYGGKCVTRKDANIPVD